MANMVSALWQGENASFIVALHNQAAPSDGEWQSFCELVRTHYATSKRTLCGITFTLGGGPNAKQRKQLAELVGDRAEPGCIITNNSMIRGVITAFAWIAKMKLKGFRPSDHRAALLYAGVAPEELDRALIELGVLGEKVDGGNPVTRLVGGGGAAAHA